MIGVGKVAGTIRLCLPCMLFLSAGNFVGLRERVDIERGLRQRVHLVRHLVGEHGQSNRDIAGILMPELLIRHRIIHEQPGGGDHDIEEW